MASTSLDRRGAKNGTGKPSTSVISSENEREKEKRWRDEAEDNKIDDKIDGTTTRTNPDNSAPTFTAASAILNSIKRHAFSVRPFHGIVQDIRSRALYYASDWTDAWNYRVVPATLLIFFANVLPGIAFSLDLIETTNQYGVAEVLLSSFMASFILSVFGAQPLCIAGVTGPITVLNKTIFDILQGHEDAPDYLQFIGWVYLWGAILHWITAALNWCNFLKYVTRFSCDTFGFFVSWVYLQYGVQVLTRQFSSSSIDGAFVQIILALVMLVLCYMFLTLAHTTLFHRHVRRFFADYGMPISLVATTGLAYWGHFNRANPETLPIAGAFQPAGGRDWLVRFWDLPGKWVGIAFPFGFVLWVLFFFDHNVSSLIAQGSEFPLRKPPGFHYDFFLLGITTFIAGLLGVPAPNGLIPQAPIHTTSLLVMGRRVKDDVENTEPGGSPETESGSLTNEETINNGGPLPEPDPSPAQREIPVAVVEQRVSNLAQGALCLVLLTGPFLHLLHLIPRGVLAGLFWFMGADALQGNGITAKLVFLVQDHRLTPQSEPLRRVRKSRIVLFALVQLAGFGATFAIVQTIAAIGFPVIILLLIPLRSVILPLLPFTEEELAILDRPTASPFTMESVGGSL
ncbi:HCO3 transporter family-domain-containing protein [Phellopilus nigrolimitatus]|nr:HCO3 transporter family-domain-containing protein [Phellopilus nigrolimitatus]